MKQFSMNKNLIFGKLTSTGTCAKVSPFSSMKARGQTSSVNVGNKHNHDLKFPSITLDASVDRAFPHMPMTLPPKVILTKEKLESIFVLNDSEKSVEKSVLYFYQISNRHSALFGSARSGLPPRAPCRKFQIGLTLS
jgi:hypothetical protein